MDGFTLALRLCIEACGGVKQVAALLWPEKTLDAAQRLLLDCLNPDRPAHLTPEQVLMVLRLARARGHHEAMDFICADAGYGKPMPIEPLDEVTELQRQYIEAIHQSAQIAERMERATSRFPLRAVK